MANNLVTELYLASNFTPRSGITPGSDDHEILNCNEILPRYYVTISPSTGNYCPKQSELTGAAFATGYIMYNYFAAAGNITASGWRIPSITEYEALVTYLGGYSASLLKLKSTTSWSTAGNNSSGLNYKSNGGCAFSPSYTYGAGTFMLNWSTTSYSTNQAYHFGIQNTSVWTEYQSKYLGGTARAIRNTANADGVVGTYVGNDGKYYSTICLNGIEWTSQDLEETKYVYGSTIPYVTDGTTWYNNGLAGIACCTAYGEF